MKSLFSILFLFAGLWIAQAANETFKVSGFEFTRPTAWQWVESTSPMRKAELAVPAGTESEKGEIVFFHFGQGQGGDTQSNITRWYGQFVEPKDQLKSKTDKQVISGKTV